jgi:hypothetical protein
MEKSLVVLCENVYKAYCNYCEANGLKGKDIWSAGYFF